MSLIPRPPRRHPRRSPGVHRAPLAAPETPAEVLERAPDVSRETSGGPMAPYVAGGLPPDRTPSEPWNPPPLHKTQIARLEAITAIWQRDVRLEVPVDATMLYAAPKPPPPPARRPAPETFPRLEVVPPVPDEAEVAAVSAELLADDAPRTPGPVPSPAPGMDPGPVPARVSDWSSRHDPASLDYAVLERLGRPVPLADVSLAAGLVLDQGTVPPLSVHDASACVGMACTTAANVLLLAADHPTGSAGQLNEDVARRIYARAQELDQVHGEDYAGTSVLAGMKAGQEAGWWGGYLWALRGTRDIAQVIVQLRLPVVIGVPWSQHLENPDAAGIIAPGGQSLGGHALAVVGLALAVAGRPGPWFELQQSRGPAEGKAGRVFLHHKHLAQLLAGIGEAAVPYPAGMLR